jgi:hypothetical protein
MFIIEDDMGCLDEKRKKEKEEREREKRETSLG